MATRRLQPDLNSERGAVIVHVTIALVGLLAFGTFVVDYGVMWAARRQAQNAADAAALAGAISLAYVDFNDQALARQSALAVAAQNKVWGDAPDVTAADVTFPPCPPGSPGVGTSSCVRVDVFRNERSGGNPLPTFFGKIAGIADQGVRATATAEALFGNSTDCVKPFAVADKWTERVNDQLPLGWSENDTFERYGSKGALLDPADVYEGGFTPAGVSSGGGDYGRYITLKHGSPHDTLTPGWFQPVVINPAEGPGGANYRDNIAKCDTTVIGPGTLLDVEPGNMIGPTKQGMDELIDLDPDAKWDPNRYGTGKGGIKGGCMSSTTAPCAISPRLVAIPVFNPDAYQLADKSGRTTIQITKVLGFFIDKMQGNDVMGYLMTYPAEPSSGMGGTPGSGFVVSVALVR
jgi:Putative Flp pilus-assembly TadE/G-like